MNTKYGNTAVQQNLGNSGRILPTSTVWCFPGRALNTWPEQASVAVALEVAQKPYTERHEQSHIWASSPLGTTFHSPDYKKSCSQLRHLKHRVQETHGW